MPEAFRQYAQYWLMGDELREGRSMGLRDSKARISLLRQIERLYARAESREDVENIELQVLHTSYTTPFFSRGLQVHLPYTAYAHWLIVHRIPTGAGVKRVQANLDIDSMGRAAFLSAFVDEVRRGDAHAFYVRATKHQTIDERREILGESRRAYEAFRSTLPPSVRKDGDEVARRPMKARIDMGQKHGKWDDEWVEHPLPTLNEPHKAMAWLTADTAIDEDRKADMFLRSGMRVIDNVFAKTRRLINPLERPLDTVSGRHTVWYGYSPYNVAMLEKYPTIFRAVSNFVFVGDAGDAAGVDQAGTGVRGHPMAGAARAAAEADRGGRMRRDAFARSGVQCPQRQTGISSIWGISGSRNGILGIQWPLDRASTQAARPVRHANRPPAIPR